MGFRTRARAIPTARLAALLGLIGAAVSFAGSWIPSLWTDEGDTITGATKSWSDFWPYLGNIDAVHAVAIAFWHLWIDVFGTSAVLLRLPSALAVAVAVAGMFVIGEQLAGRRVGVWAAVVLMVLPRVTSAGLEARSYAMTIAVSVWLTIAVLAARRHGGWQRWLLYALGATIGTFLHIYLVLVLAAHGVALLLIDGWRDRRFRHWVVAVVCAVLPALPFIAYVTTQKGMIGVPVGGLGAMARQVIINQFFLGQTPTLATGQSVPLPVPTIATWWKYASVVAAAVTLLLVASGILRARLGRGVSARDDEARPWVWGLTWALVPLALVVAYAIVSDPDLYNVRYLSYTSAGLALVMGTALARMSVRSASAFALVIALALFPVYLSQRTTYSKSGTDWSVATAWLAARSTPGDGVYFAPRRPLAVGPARRTTRTTEVVYPEAFTGLVDITQLQTTERSYDLVGRSRLLQDSEAELAAVNHVWAIARNDYNFTADNQTLIEAGFTESDTFRGSLTTVREYGRPR